MLLHKQTNVLHQMNIYRLKTLDLAFESAIDVGKWDEALRYGNDLIPGFRYVLRHANAKRKRIFTGILRTMHSFCRKYNGESNPLLGLLHMKVGKIQLFNGDSKEALHNLNKASDILKVTHGEDDDLYKKELMPLLIQAAAECDHDVDDDDDDD